MMWKEYFANGSGIAKYIPADDTAVAGPPTLILLDWNGKECGAATRVLVSVNPSRYQYKFNGLKYGSKAQLYRAVGGHMTGKTVRPLTLEQAKAKFINRFTMDHVPVWATRQREDGTYYAPQFASDAEWYALATFPGEGNVAPNCRHLFAGVPTWPLGQSLDHPYRVGA